MLSPHSELIPKAQLPSPSVYHQMFTSHSATLITSLRFTFLQDYLYQKDERVPRGTFRAANFSGFPAKIMIMLMIIII